MNIDGRLEKYKKDLEQSRVNMYWLQGAIAALEELKKDEEQPIVEIAKE